MQLTERRSEGLLRVYDVVVPAAELQQKLNAKIDEVPPTHPDQRIPAREGPGQPYPQGLRRLDDAGHHQRRRSRRATRDSLEKVNARPASEPSLDLKSDLTQVVAGQADLQFELSLEIIPEIEPIDLKTITITRPVAPVSDDQVADALAELVKARRGFEDKDGAAADGDAVVVDFVGRVDGEAFEGGSAQGAQVVIGSKQFIPGFEEQLIGAKAGDERTLNVTFPDDYPVDRLKGKAAQFETKVTTVRAPKSGDPDDAWASELGFDSLGSLKDALRQRIENEHAAQSRAKAKRALFDKLDTAHSFDLPPRMVEAEFNQIWRQIEADRTAGRLDPSDEGKSDDELKAEYRAIAERRVRLGLVLAEIGRRHKARGFRPGSGSGHFGPSAELSGPRAPNLRGLST